MLNRVQIQNWSFNLTVLADDKPFDLFPFPQASIKTMVFKVDAVYISDLNIKKRSPIKIQPKCDRFFDSY